MAGFSRIRASKLALALFGACFLLACASASGPEFVAVAVPEDKAVLYFYRSKSIMGSALEQELYVNGQYVTRVMRGGYIAHIVEPGEVDIRTTQFAESLKPFSAIGVLRETREEVESGGRMDPGKLTVAADEVRYFRFDVKFGGRFELVEVTEDVGSREIAKLRLLPGAAARE